MAEFRAEQEAIKKRAADRHAEEKGLREQQVKRLQVVPCSASLFGKPVIGSRYPLSLMRAPGSYLGHGTCAGVFFVLFPDGVCFRTCYVRSAARILCHLTPDPVKSVMP